MTEESINKAGRFNQNQTQNNDEIDLMALVGKLLEKKLFIIVFTFVFTLFGIAYALFTQPVYQANTVLQIENKNGGMPGLTEMSDMFATESESVTEIELLKSRMIIGKTVDKLNLDISVTPKLFPIIGNYIYRRYRSVTGEVAEPLIEGYAWGGEQLEISQLEVPDTYNGKTFILRALNEQKYQLLFDDEVILTGIVATKVEQQGFIIEVKTLKAQQGTEFIVTKRKRLNTILNYQTQIQVAERGKGSGILEVSLESTKPEEAKRIVDTIASLYVLQNVERNSAEATKSLEFLKQQLPELKLQLEKAEQKFNDYQVSAQSVNIQSETEALLRQVVDIESQISALQLKKVDVERRFKPDHPTFQSLESQLAELEIRRENYQQQVKKLPATQQELLRLRRDVEVSTEIYTQMLNNTQELDIIRAGTIGNVRIIDDAVVNIDAPVKPKKKLIVVIAIFIGGVFSVFIVLIRAALNRGVENPEQIEEMGLPVYAAIPYSDSQAKLEKLFGRKFSQNSEADKQLLAVSNPTDLSIEALRSLRTSLHFAMMEAKNNIVMISGPSPSVGKSFISANLAATIAQTGQKVLLIDADLRKGYIHKMFGLTQGKGLSDCLAGQLADNELVVSTDIDNLSFVTRGTIPPNPSELLTSEKFAKLLAQFSQQYDLVLIDTPPILAVTDAAIVGKLAGTSMLVTRFRLNPLKEIEIAARRFEQNGVDVKGVIFNAVERKSNAYGYGYGYGYYTYEYGSDSDNKKQ